MASSTAHNLSRTLSSPTELEVLDPSPVSETPTPASSRPKDSYFPAQPRSGSTSPASLFPSPTLLRSIQKYSSYTFTVFAALHISNTALLPLLTRDTAAASPYLLLTRPYYQSWPLAEPLIVIAPLLAHVGAGLALRAQRRATLLKRYGYADPSPQTQSAAVQRAPWPPVSLLSASGFASSFLVAGHAALNRLLPLYADGGSSAIGLDFVGHGVASHPALGYAGFGVLVAVVGAHMVWGWAKWLGLMPPPAAGAGAGADRERVLSRKRRLYGVWGIAAGIVGVWIAGGVGIVAANGRVGGWVGEVYDGIYRAVPVLGRYM